LHTWLDRDLSLAGRVTDSEGKTRLLRIDQPICRISNLAIHLNQTLATNGLQLNPQQHLTPALGLVQDTPLGIADLVSEELSRTGHAVAPGELLGFDLCLYDTQPSAIGGSAGEFLFAPRLDNLASCHAALTSLMAQTTPCAATRVVVLYDHEEVGSQSASGAKSQFLIGCLGRLAHIASQEGEASARALARSLLISIDMAHAVHPGYAEKHDPNHMPKLGAGPVIKVNANQSYATDGPTTALFEAACKACDVPSQRFVSRNDLRCGSTIGPLSAAQTGIRTIDVGNPMLSMHSCREVACTLDVEPMIRVLSRLLETARVPLASD
jgi:aspartyl aminopeptidase